MKGQLKLDAADRSAPEAIRLACLQAAIDAYEDGGLRGLCEQGRWELALDAIRSINLDSIIERAENLSESKPAESS